MDFGLNLVASIRFGDLYRFSKLENSVATSAMFVSMRWLVVGRPSLLTCSDVICLPMISLLFVSLDWQRCWVREGVDFPSVSHHLVHAAVSSASNEGQI